MISNSPDLTLEGISSRITKGIILVVWISILLWFAMIAASGKSITTIERTTSFLKPIQKAKSSDQSPASYLRTYLGRFERHPPPLVSLLDLIAPRWSESDFTSVYRQNFHVPADSAGVDIKRIEEFSKEQCYLLFDKSCEILQSIVSDRSLDPKDLSISVPDVPVSFQYSNIPRSKTIKLPQTVALWIVEQRSRDDLDNQRNALVDTFFNPYCPWSFWQPDFFNKGLYCA